MVQRTFCTLTKFCTSIASGRRSGRTQHYPALSPRHLHAPGRRHPGHRHSRVGHVTGRHVAKDVRRYALKSSLSTVRVNILRMDRTGFPPYSMTFPVSAASCAARPHPSGDRDRRPQCTRAQRLRPGHRGRHHEAAGRGEGVGAQEAYQAAPPPRWVRQVDDLFAGKRLPPMMDFGLLPRALRLLPARTKKLRLLGDVLLMPAGKAMIVRNDHPEVTKDVWLRLPQLIANPEMILRGNPAERSGDLRDLTRETLPDGRQVVVAIKSQGVDAQNRPATVAITTYGLDRLKDVPGQGCASARGRSVRRRQTRRRRI